MRAVLDAGALIAVDRRARRGLVLMKRIVERELTVAVMTSDPGELHRLDAQLELVAISRRSWQPTPRTARLAQ